MIKSRNKRIKAIVLGAVVAGTASLSIAATLPAHADTTVLFKVNMEVDAATTPEDATVAGQDFCENLGAKFKSIKANGDTSARDGDDFKDVYLVTCKVPE